MTVDPSREPPPKQLQAATARLLDSIGVRATFSLTPLFGGKNNRTFRVNYGTASAAIKWYYSHPSDPRDRLETEFRFCEFCWAHQIKQVPKPLAQDRAEQLGLYEWVNGECVPAGSVISKAQIDAALQFVVALNHHRHTTAAAQLADGSEACFQIADHLQCVADRVERLNCIEPPGPIGSQAVALIRERLTPIWQATRDSIERRWRDRDHDLGIEDRCLSPSDFGFHNALVEGNSIRFLDFEYAGWDDAAKLVCDFFCQVERPVSMHYWSHFVDSLARVVRDRSSLMERCTTLLPAYHIKWACIVLNEFLPDHRARRQFSGAGQIDDQKLGEQLAKAEQLLVRAESPQIS